MARLERYLVEELGVVVPVTHRWVGIVGYTGDERPLAGHVPGVPGLYALGGYCGSGNVNAWVAGRIVADLIADGQSPDEDLLEPDRTVSIVKINAITVPRERFDEFAERFAARAGRVAQAEGFEAFELLRPNDDRDVCLVFTRWRCEEDFQAWMPGPDFARRPRPAPRPRARSGTASELWSFDVLEREGPQQP